jgi:hypothetical protein
VFSKKAFLDVGGFYEEYGVVSDYIIGYMMLKYGYRFYSLRNKVGYYRIQSNESMKLETNQCFVKGDYYFREFMYSESLPHRVFGVVFRRVQYTYSLKGLVKNAGDFGVNVKVSDMAFKGGYGRCPVRSFIFKVIRKMYYMFFAPKDMTIPLI